MISFGAERSFVFRIFLIEGLLICARGIFYGLLIGYLVCFVQIKWSILMMPGAAGLPFPVRLSVMDASVIIGLVTGLSLLFSYLPVRFLMRRNFEHITF
jgi:lipoprotein-releasing system permease protein